MCHSGGRNQQASKRSTHLIPTSRLVPYFNPIQQEDSKRRRRRQEEFSCLGHGRLQQIEIGCGSGSGRPEGERRRVRASGRALLLLRSSSSIGGGVVELLRGVRAARDPRPPHPPGAHRLLLHRPSKAHRLVDRVPGRGRRGVPGGRDRLRRRHRRRPPPQGLRRHVRLLRLPLPGCARGPPAHHGQGAGSQGRLLGHPRPHDQRRHRGGRRRGQALPLRKDAQGHQQDVTETDSLHSGVLRV